MAANTLILLHCDGNDEGARFVDASENHIITANGGVKTDNTQKKFGVTSAKFDGDADYLTIPDHANWDFGNADFCIEFQLYFTGNPASNQALIICADAIVPTSGWAMFLKTSGTVIFKTPDFEFDCGYGLGYFGTNQWHHVLCARWDDNLIRLFVGGLACGNAYAIGSVAINSDGDPMWIGGSKESGGSFYFDEYLDEIRISNIARYTAAFDEPTEAYLPADPRWSGKVNSISTPGGVLGVSGLDIKRVNNILAP